VYITFGLFTNILVTAMLLTGGSAVITSLTGVPTAAACFLLPLGVVVYTMFGGIKATFLTDYVHTVILLVILLTFAYTTYASGDVLGSTKVVYERLNALSATTPVPGNAGGSYLTMKSKDGAIFFVINIIGNFGTVFMDNGCKCIFRDRLYATLLTFNRLQQGDCCFSSTCSSWIHHRRIELVCYSLVVRHHSRTCCSVPPELRALPDLPQTHDRI
jgi:Na+/proline symporter